MSLVTPSVNYRDLLRRLLLCVEDHQMKGISQDAEMFSEEERKILQELWDGGSV